MLGCWRRWSVVRQRGIRQDGIPFGQNGEQLVRTFSAKARHPSLFELRVAYASKTPEIVRAKRALRSLGEGGLVQFLFKPLDVAYCRLPTAMRSRMNTLRIIARKRRSSGDR